MARSDPRYEIVATGEIWDGHSGVNTLLNENKQGFSNFQFQPETMHHSDSAVIVEGRFTGTHDGSWRGLPATGRKVGEVAGRGLKKVALELGGNNAIIISQDADLNIAIPGAIFGAVGTAGQRCTTTRRLIIHDVKQGYEGGSRKIDIVQAATRFREHLTERHGNQFQVRKKTLTLGLRQSSKQMVLFRIVRADHERRPNPSVEVPTPQKAHVRGSSLSAKYRKVN